MNIEKIEELADIIIKVRLNTAALEEREQLNEWLFASNANLKIYSNIMSGEFLSSHYMMEEEYAEIYNISTIKREIIKKITQKHQKKQFIRLRTSLAASAAILVFIVMGYFVTNSIGNYSLRRQTPEAVKAIASKIEPIRGKVVLEMYNGDKIELNREIDAIIENKSAQLNNKAENSGQIRRNTITTPKGTTYNVTLSDGTKVWMNENSKLTYPIEFLSDRREVEVVGEAYFEVVSHPQIAFYVIGKKGSVRVLGTKFNFSSSEEQTVTTLVEGSVEVNSQKTKIIITPSQQATIREDIEVKEVDVAAITAWKDGKYIFRGKALAEIMDYLANWYDIKIEYDESVKKDLKLSGVIYKFTTFAEVIEVLEATKQISIKVKDENNIKIFSN